VDAGEAWDLWSIGDGRRVGFVVILDDGHVVYALATVKRGTPHEEVLDLVEGFFPPSSTDAEKREIVVSEFDHEPQVFGSSVHSE
jgi:hypothetical protein